MSSDTGQFHVQLDGQEYDIERFLRDHPGGVRTLERYRGRSIAEGMGKFRHSSAAYHMLSDFRVIDANDNVTDLKSKNDNETELSDSNLTGDVSENGRIITKEESGRDRKEIAFLEELEGKLDWSKPLLSQLNKIAPHYEKWVNSSVYRQLRLFKSPILESCTFTPWYVVPAVWIPVILYMGWSQLVRLVFCGDACPEVWLSLPAFLLHICFGISTWTGIEYSLHRWVFHLDPGQSLALIKLHFIIHGIHHKVPFDRLRQVFPPLPAAVLAGLLYIPVHSVFAYPLVEMTGGLIGYLTYDMIHYYVHHGSPRPDSYLYRMKRYHSNHHFVSHDKAFGISNKLWDYVFKTLAHVRKLGFNLYW